jgi:hypothetical protein
LYCSGYAETGRGCFLPPSAQTCHEEDAGPLFIRLAIFFLLLSGLAEWNVPELFQDAANKNHDIAPSSSGNLIPRDQGSIFFTSITINFVAFETFLDSKKLMNTFCVS